MRKINLVGQIFGRLTVIKEDKKKYKKKEARWICRCVCGKETSVTAYGLRSGASQSCGCLRAELSSVRMVTHGQNRGLGKTTSEYLTWRNIKSRCYNKNNTGFYLYGGRGIKVCDRWLNSFENFFADMGKKPSKLHSIDRYPNKNGDYKPTNCRWATEKEQHMNKRTSVNIED